MNWNLGSIHSQHTLSKYKLVDWNGCQNKKVQHHKLKTYTVYLTKPYWDFIARKLCLPLI